MGDIPIICCACLVEATDESEIVQLSLLADEENGLTYGDCLKICTNFEVEGILCSNCGHDLEISYKFLRKITKSQEILSELKDEDVDVINFQNDSNELQDQQQQDEQIVEEFIEETEDWLTEADVEQDESREYIVIQEEQTEEVNFKEEIEENGAETIYPQAVETDSAENSNFDEIIEEVSIDTEVSTTSPKNTKLHALLESNNSLEEESSPIVDDDDQIKPKKRFFGKFNCEYCGKMFPNHSRMLIHRRTHERVHSAYNCKLCGRMYASDQALSVHIRTTHNDLNDGLKCTICSKVFSSKHNYSIHMRYHSKEFPFHCGICDKHFVQKSHLNAHKNIHNGLRFICVQPNCGKLFTSSPALREHEFTHTIMPFECNLCRGGYPSKSKLKAHLLKVHFLEYTLDELETMREFHPMRSKPNVLKLSEETT